MSFFRFITKSLFFFRKQHFAVFVGTLISTAVLTGALITGDSVKYSLRRLVDMRLGNAKYVLQTGDRFIRSKIAGEISEKLKTKTSSMLVLSGTAVNTKIKKRINKIQVIGTDNLFWKLSGKKIPKLNENEVVISLNIAEKLNLKKEDEFLLKVENTGIIPVNAPFASEIEQTKTIRLTVKNIADDENLGRFSLKSNQKAPYNIFISHDFLAEKLELNGLANVIIVAENEQKKINSEKLNKIFHENWKLADAEIKLKKTDENKYEILSERIFIDKQITEVIENLNIKNEKILTYLVNNIYLKNKNTPYSFISAASENFLQYKLKENEIIINQWLANDIDAKINDTLKIDYFKIGNLRKLEEKTSEFIIKKIVKIEGNFADSSLMPDFPGLSDAENCNDWETSIPIDLKKIRNKDEEYWKIRKGTPKAFISMQAGLNLWENKFGNYTSLRFNENEIKANELKTKLLRNLKPENLNLIFTDMRSEGLRAANNSVDFAELFLSLSFFVIVAGILLTILIYVFNTESRNQETGILSGLGFNKKYIIKMRLAESSAIIIFGAIFGAIFGILYNQIIVSALNSIWYDAVKTNMISVNINFGTIIKGIAAGIIIAFSVIYFVLRKKLKQSSNEIIRNNKDISSKKSKNKKRINIIISGIIAICVLIILIFVLLNSPEKNSGLILTAGGLFIIGGISFVALILDKISTKKIFDKFTNTKKNGIKFLAIKNSAVNKSRSLSVIGLLALGIFTVIITASNRKTFYGDENNRKSGTGGFLFWLETSIPILHDLNTLDGKKHYGLEDETILNGADFIQFHSLSGDDASCLNLNQVNKAQILGINPDYFNSRKAFSFDKILENIDKKNTWNELKKSYGKNIIPAFADQTVIQWGLMKKIGDTLKYLNEAGEEIKVLLIGGLQSSVFQGNILIADSFFTKNFPSSSGSKIMLVDAPENNKKEISEIIEARLIDYGIEITPTTKRLAEFYSVTNTYLSVFMMLGGLGFIIGIFGLGIVIIRNMLERKQEIAILTALGFAKNNIFKLIFTENIFLLIAGFVIGIFAAIIGIIPSLISPAFNIPETFVFTIIIIIFANGIIWIYLPIKKAVSGKLINALRNE